MASPRAVAVQVLAAVGDAALGVVAAALPRAWRPVSPSRWDEGLIPLVSSMAQVAIAFAGGVTAYAAYRQGALDEMWRYAQSQARHTEHDEITLFAAHSLNVGMLFPLLFIFTTVAGAAWTAAFVGGVVRVLSVAVTRHNTPDPVLSLVEVGRSALARRLGLAVRERAKGAEAPDLLLFADGADGWRVRIVSRHEYPWRVGNTIAAAGGHYLLVARRETRDEAGRLRMEYDLDEHPLGQPFRGVRSYAPRVPPRYS